MLEKILAHPWQFCLVVLVATIAFWIVSRSVESPLSVVGDFFMAIHPILEGEIRGKTLAGIVNVVINFFSFILAVGLVTPNILYQLGLLVEEQPDFGMALIGVCLFAGTALGCVLLMNSFFKELDAYSDNHQQ